MNLHEIISESTSSCPAHLASTQNTVNLSVTISKPTVIQTPPINESSN